jgi:catechol 2,3-dioxygenase-like lactoylglutathione lyase family enzyme
MRASYAFYASLGFATVYGGADATFTSMRAGIGFVNLQRDPDYVRGEQVWGRVIFWVDDVDAMYERACTAGIVAEMAPSDAPWGERYFHVLDPDGHELSFARPLPRS